MLAVAAYSTQTVALGCCSTDAPNLFTERLEDGDKNSKTEIQDLRDETIEAEADRLERIADLQLDHNRRILDLEEELQRDLEDLRRARFDDARDDALDYTRDLEDLQNQYARKLFGDSIISFGDLTEQQPAATPAKRRIQAWIV